MQSRDIPTIEAQQTPVEPDTTQGVDWKVEWLRRQFPAASEEEKAQLMDALHQVEERVKADLQKKAIEGAPADEPAPIPSGRQRCDAQQPKARKPTNREKRRAKRAKRK